MATPTAADAPKSSKRVQGLKSDVEDLVLRSSGKPVAIEIGPRETEQPTLTRTIEGGSSIDLNIFDPEGVVLRKSLLSEQWDAEVDGLNFRYTGLSKSEQTLTLTLEDLWITKLKEAFGYQSVLRKDSTRAEFIKRLVEEACPGLEFFCPQLHRKQSVGTNKEKFTEAKKEKETAAKEGEKAQEEAKENRGPGIGANTKGLTIAGAAPTPAQTKLAELALHIANAAGAPYVVQVALIAALIDENDMSGPNCLQGEQEITGEGGEGAAVQSNADEISGFLTGKPHWDVINAMDYNKENPQSTYYEIAQAVQVSGAGESTNGAANYGKFGAEARQWVTVFWGNAEGGSVGAAESETVIEPFRFERKHKESSWAAIKRLAKEVNWRAFIVGNRFYFMPEPELFRSIVRMAIDQNTPGVENIDFEYHVLGEVTELTVTAFAKDWKAPPGSVVTLEDYGPASIGEAPKKGELLPLPSALPANAPEGQGRYLVASIEVPMSRDPALRLATITLKTPTKPLPEPKNKTKSVSSGATGGTGNPSAAGAPAKVQAIIAYIDAATEQGGEYLWGGGHGSFGSPSDEKDCSGFVSAAVHAGDFLSTPLTSGSFLTEFPLGVGEWVTIYASATHVFMRVKYPDGHWRYAGTGGPTGSGGWVEEDNETSGAPSRGDKTACHPPGL